LKAPFPNPAFHPPQSVSLFHFAAVSLAIVLPSAALVALDRWLRGG
jgi:hypothetical protein